MRIVKRATLEEIGPATWPAFADDIGLAASFVRRRVKELSDAEVAQVRDVSARPALAVLDASALKAHAAVIASRAERLARTITR
jgi:hypothetical protein